jgi:hypothetical protein
MVTHEISVNFTKKSFLFLIGSLSIFQSCAPRKENIGNNRTGYTSGTPEVTWDGSGMDGFSPDIEDSEVSDQLLLAAVDCDCGRSIVSKYLQEKVSKRGVLPQILVPQIREEVSKDSKLQILNKLPLGLGQPLKSFFASDDKIASEVRGALTRKLSNSLSRLGGTKLAQRFPFRFDLFRGQKGQMSSQEQVVYWNVVLDKPGLWSDQPPVDGIDHGLQLLETMRTAAEWAYIFGLGGDGKPNGFGGLASDIKQGHGKLVIPYDPSSAPAGAGMFFSGDFEVSYESGMAVDQATKVKESWSFKPSDVPLLEQARLWKAAATAFNNFRVDRSKNTSVLFRSQDGALSKGVEKLPLVWLGGMSEILEKNYINADTRLVKQNAFGVSQDADLESLLAMGEALHQWREATKNSESLDLDKDLKNKLLEAPEKLLKPLRLAIQTILSKHTYIQSNPSLKFYVGSSKDEKPADARLAARVIRFLATVEQGDLSSPELKNKIMSLVSSHAPLWSSRNPVDRASAIEAYLALYQVKQYVDAPDWVPKLMDVYREVLKSDNG